MMTPGKIAPSASDVAINHQGSGSSGRGWLADEAMNPSLRAKQLSVSCEKEEHVRQQLSNSPEAVGCSDQMINQYLRATGGDVSTAVKRIRDTLQWRQREQPDRITCPACSVDPKSHYLHPVGFDLCCRPVLYSCLQLASNRKVEDNRQHMISTFEQAIQLMPPHAEQWIWFSDFHGFGFQDCDSRLGRIFLDVSATYYPERLGTFVVVDAPRIFSTVWSLLRPLVDPVTRAKIVFLPYDVKATNSTLKAALSRYFDPELASWLECEMAQNRLKQVAKRKAYPYSRVLDPPAGLSSVRVEGHDIRGTPAMLEAMQKLAARPST